MKAIDMFEAVAASPRPRRSVALLAGLFLQKGPNQRGNFDSLFLQSEVAGIEQVELHVLQVTLVRIGPGVGKNRVVLAQDDEHRRLIFAKIFLPLRVERRVAAVAIKERELNFLVARTIQKRLIMHPRVRTDRFQIFDAVRVLPFRRVERQDRVPQLVAVLFATVLPVDLDRLPEIVVDAFIVGVAILDDQRLHALRMLDGQAKSNRGTVVHEIDRVFFQADLVREFFDDVRQVIEGVFEFGHRGSRATPVAGIIWGDYMEFACQEWNQISKHVRGRGKAVQQEDGGYVLGTSFAIEDVEAVDLYRAVKDLGRFRKLGSADGFHDS